MRIVIINNLYPPYQVGGAEKSVSLLAEALSRSGDDVSVITLHPEKEEQTSVINGVRVYRLPMENNYWPFTADRPVAPVRLLWHINDMWNRRAASKVRKILEIEKPDVVHTNNLAGFSVAVWNEAKRLKIRLVHTMRDYYLLCSKSTIFNRNKLCRKTCVACKILTCNRREQSELLDAVVANSQYVLDAHVSRGYFANTQKAVIFNIIEPIRVAQERNESDPCMVFGYMGRLEPAKGIEVLLKATKRITKSNWRLKIAGSGTKNYVEALQKSYSGSEIEWLGFVKPSEFYPAIDVGIVPSAWPEPLPRTAINTLAAGRGLICSDAGGSPDVARMGKKVNIYPSQDAGALARIMDSAIEDAQAWRAGGWLNADSEEEFSEETIVRKYHAVYEGKQELVR